VTLAELRAIALGEPVALTRELAAAAFVQGATRQNPRDFFFDEIKHYIYAGDTALHLAAAGYRSAAVRKLVKLGADPNARNRRGHAPLHYAVDGGPSSAFWNPRAQAATLTALIDAGADLEAMDKNGTTPLERAVRNRCAMAVKTLLDAGARPGDAPRLATQTTGRGGTALPEARAQQEEILRLLASRAPRKTRAPE